MRYLSLFVALLLAGSSLAAHAQPAATPLVATPPSASTPDTVAAIHRLFVAKRHQSALVISSTVGVGLLSLVVAENTRHSYTIDATPVIATGISLLSIPATFVEIVHYQQFTRRKEQRAIAAFEAHKLPEKIRLRLQPTYFDEGRSR